MRAAARLARESRAVAVPCAAMLASLTACELSETAIAPTEPILVVHSVLNRSALNQVVLLERSLTGQTFVISRPFSAADPIVTGRGIAVSGATVTLLLPDGSSVLAREDAATRADRVGAGVYRAPLAGNALVPGGTYGLRVRTADGDELTATTTIPEGTPASVLPVRAFNRDGDPLALTWTPSADQSRFAIQILSGYGPFSTWTDIASASISGSLRHTTVEGLPRVFTAGFDHTVTVMAVDSNYYDYFRTNNLPWTGTGVVSRINGGIGVFGAAVRVFQQTVQVSKTRTAPIEARFEYSGTPIQQASSIARFVDLFVESPANVASQPDAISGRYTTYTGVSGGVTGTFRDGELRIAFLRGFNRLDTLERFTGQLRGDSLTGTYANFAVPARFARISSGN